MTHPDIVALRLHNQHITDNKLKNPTELVQHMGAIQAQDFSMCKWAIGSRMQQTTDAEIQKALDEGEILRTHVMRPTWHLVAAKDIYWMLELSAPQIRSAMKAHKNKLGITPELLKKSFSVMEKALRENHLSREYLIGRLHNHKIETHEHRSSLILMEAEIEGLICSGPMVGNKQSYALIENRIRKIKALERKDAIEKLTRKYFTSHAPAALEDFVWWSGLPVRDARLGIESLQKDFVAATIDGRKYWLPANFDMPGTIEKYQAQLLPSFDEYIISYKDRSAVLEKVHHKKAVSVNGIFSPIVVINGQVTGTWSRTIAKETVGITVKPFVPIPKKMLQALGVKAEGYAEFIEKKLTAFTIEQPIQNV